MDLNGRGDLKVVQNSLIHVTEMDDEMGYMNVEKGLYFFTDSIGTTIWRVIKEPKSLVEVVNQLMGEYNVDYEMCYDHTKELLENMLDNDLILTIKQ